MKKNLFSILTLVVFIFSGCATKDPIVLPTLVFPQYPDVPRILYLKSYRGGKAQFNTGFTGSLDALLGDSNLASGSSNIIKPYGVGLLNGKLYVADPGSKSVFVIDENTSKADFLGTSGKGRLSNPISIAFDDKNIVYVSDSRLNSIQGYDSDGKLKFALGGRLEFSKSTGIAIDKKSNHLYVVDTKAHHIKAFDIETKKYLFTIGKRGKGDGEFNYPTNVSVDRRNSNIVVCDTQNFRVQIFDKYGNFIRKFGKVGDRPGQFARPKGVAVDSEGNIYVTDSAFNNIQIFNDQGKLLMWFGSAGYSRAQFRLITGIYIDEHDKIAVADGFSGRVEVFQFLSENWKAKNQKKYNELLEFKEEK